MFKKHLIATSLVALTLSAAAHARPYKDNETVYFSDQAKKTVVGTLYMDCYGHTTRTGIVTQGKSTPYWLRYQETCPGGLHDLGVKSDLHIEAKRLLARPGTVLQQGGE